MHEHLKGSGGALKSIEQKGDLHSKRTVRKTFFVRLNLLKKKNMIFLLRERELPKMTIYRYQKNIAAHFADVQRNGHVL